MNAALLPLSFLPSKTVFLIDPDPPQKGCDEPFLEQLLRFGSTHEQRKGKYVLESGHRLDMFL
ncbi:hypothetical protein K438DRAFT_2000222 [Mycena galopus ATCC 62051]|nr:hypothetical protein K438DRAFT_2000222 [Mycena galopus ATCC 62051]